MMSSSFLFTVTLKTSNFSNFCWIKLKFGLRADFETLILNFNSKIGLIVEIGQKGIIPLILVKYSLSRWSPWQQGNVYSQTINFGIDV